MVFDIPNSIGLFHVRKHNDFGSELSGYIAPGWNFPVLMLPLFITISIARTKLFDIDLIINRSLVYGILTIGLGLTFATALGLRYDDIQKFSSRRPITPRGHHIFRFSGGTLSTSAKKTSTFRGPLLLSYTDRLPRKSAGRNSIRSRNHHHGNNILIISQFKFNRSWRNGRSLQRHKPDKPQTRRDQSMRAALASEDDFLKQFMREAEIVFQA